MEEARLEPRPEGLTAVTDGWFVVNVRDAAWVQNEVLGSACIFEGEEAPFSQVGYTIGVLQPGQSGGRYHREVNQEDFLVLSGECIAIIEGEERHLKAWDFVHCPPWTEHVFVGSGDGPCAIVGVGARNAGEGLRYPVSDVALRHSAGVKEEATSGKVAYAGVPESTHGPYGEGLPDY